MCRIFSFSWLILTLISSSFFFPSPIVKNTNCRTMILEEHGMVMKIEYCLIGLDCEAMDRLRRCGEPNKWHRSCSFLNNFKHRRSREKHVVTFFSLVSRASSDDLHWINNFVGLLSSDDHVFDYSSSGHRSDGYDSAWGEQLRVICGISSRASWSFFSTTVRER